MDDAVFNVKNGADKFGKVSLNWIKHFTWRRYRKWKSSDNGFEGKMYKFFSRMAYQIISSSAKLQHQLMFWSKSPKGHLLVTPYGGEVSSFKAIKAFFLKILIMLIMWYRQQKSWRNAHYDLQFPGWLATDCKVFLQLK